jgi:hypothetical protein
LHRAGFGEEQRLNWVCSLYKDLFSTLQRTQLASDRKTDKLGHSVKVVGGTSGAAVSSRGWGFLAKLLFQIKIFGSPGSTFFLIIQPNEGI